MPYSNAQNLRRSAHLRHFALPLLALAAGLIASRLSAQSFTQTMVPGQSVEYFRYGAPEDAPNPPDRRFEEGVEQWWADKTTTPRPPYQYDWSILAPSGGVYRSSCTLVDQPDKTPQPIYWYGTAPSGSDPIANPVEFQISQQESGVQGFQFLGQFDAGGSATEVGPYGDAVEAVYFTDRRCTDGGREFGFANQLVANQLYFYYSDYTNCVTTDCASAPRGGGMLLSTIYSTAQITQLDVAHRYYYRATFTDPNTFQISVLDPQTLQPVGCTITGDGVNQPMAGVCQASVATQSFYNLGGNVQGTTGVLVGVIAMSGPGAYVLAGTVFAVDRIDVAH